MPTPRLLLDQALSRDAFLSLDKEASHHVARVLRLGVGATLMVFDGRGNEFEATIVEVGRELRLRLGERWPTSTESPLELTLLQGISRGDHMDLTLQKATELGVSRIVPVICTRTQGQRRGEQLLAKHRHWQRVVAAACQQCGRNRLPELTEAIDFATSCTRRWGEGPRLLLDADATQPWPTSPVDPVAVTLLIGPEGGLDAEERSAATAAGFSAVRLGPRVLRTETAAIAAITLAQLRWGDFGAARA